MFILGITKRNLPIQLPSLPPSPPPNFRIWFPPFVPIVFTTDDASFYVVMYTPILSSIFSHFKKKNKNSLFIGLLPCSSIHPFPLFDKLPLCSPILCASRCILFFYSGNSKIRFVIFSFTSKKEKK